MIVDFVCCFGIDADHLSEYFHKSSRKQEYIAEYIACKKTLDINILKFVYCSISKIAFSIFNCNQIIIFFSTCSLSFHVFFFPFNFFHALQGSLTLSKAAIISAGSQPCVLPILSRIFSTSLHDINPSLSESNRAKRRSMSIDERK